MSRRFAISMRVQSAVGYYEPRDAVSHDWLDQIRTWGGTPLPIPNLAKDIDAWLDDLVPSVLILTGGNDVILRDDQPDDRAPVRDATEFASIDWARRHDVPVFGTCRGLHVVNQYFGGNVHDISDTGSHVARDHNVKLRQPLSSLIGTDTLMVNSFHNLGIREDEVGDDLTVCAVSQDDDLVEAVVHDNEPIVALQWHPERRRASKAGVDDALFRRLLAEGAFWKDAIA